CYRRYGYRWTAPQVVHVTTTRPRPTRTRALRDGRRNARHFLQKDRLNGAGTRTLYRIPIRRASSTYRRARPAWRWSASPSARRKSVVIRSRAIRRSMPRCRRFAIGTWTVRAVKILGKPPMVSYPHIAMFQSGMAARAGLVRFVGVGLLVYLTLVV